MMNRRRFLALTGKVMTGLWLAGTGLIQLSRRMVIAFSGRCSFCGQAAGTVFGLAGVVGRSDRVCNQCIDICLNILKEEELLMREESFSSPLPYEQTNEGALELGDSEIQELLRRLEKARTEAAQARELEELRDLLDGTGAEESKDRHQGLLACSFCDRNQEASKLIAGPTVFICDVCIGDAAALISMHS